MMAWSSWEMAGSFGWEAGADSSVSETVSSVWAGAVSVATS